MSLESLKDFNRFLFGTKIQLNSTKELGLVLYTWTNEYADGDKPFVAYVDKNGKKFNTAIENVTPLNEQL